MTELTQSQRIARAWLWRIVGLLVVITMAAVFWGKPVSVTFLDVGQGDACLIQSGRGGNVLIDGGDEGSGVTLLDYLIQQNVPRLDGVFITHFHTDHFLGIQELIESGFPVSCLYLPAISQENEEELAFLALAKTAGIPIRRLREGETVTLGRITYHVLWPIPKAKYMRENNQSMVLRVEYGENRMLFTGDAEVAALGELVLDQSEVLQADVLKVPHHGGESSAYAPFLASCKPKIALIGVGVNNYYGHPSDKMLTLLAEQGTTVYRTDMDGTVTLILDKKSIKRAETTIGKWRSLQ